MRPYRIRAVNTAADSENKIHDDGVAARYGFRGGLVPGVTVYGYMTIPALEYFGEEWLEHGAMKVRFKEPVYEGEEVIIETRVLETGVIEISLEAGRATGLAWMEAGGTPPDLEKYSVRPMPSQDRRPSASHNSLAADTILGTLDATLKLADAQASAPLAAWIGEARLAHPAILLALANELLVRNVVLGPWIHVASEVENFATAHDGETLRVHGWIAEKYERAGHEFITLDILTTCGERAIQQVRHTAIWQPRISSLY
jgi:hypothetical protein